MRIVKTVRHGDSVAVHTDAFPKIGFMFPIDDIVNKDDLLAKTQIRVDNRVANNNLENVRTTKYDLLKVEDARD